MSLTDNDLGQIRQIVRDEARVIVREEIDSAISARIEPRFDKMEGNLEALENDIKEIYEMLAELQKHARPVAHFEKYNLEQKILESYHGVLAIAKEAGVKLPPA